MKRAPTELNPNSAPFNPNGGVGGVEAPAWWFWSLPERRLLSPGALAKLLTVSREVYELELGGRRRACVVGNVESFFAGTGSSSEGSGLLAHPLAQLFVAPPRERYVHPALTDHCLYWLRIDKRQRPRFALAGADGAVGAENNLPHDWLIGLVAFLYYAMPQLREPVARHDCVGTNTLACWICELQFAFENFQQALDNAWGQPINLSGFAAALLDYHAMTSITMDTAKDDLNEDVAHGLLARKMYARSAAPAPPMLAELHNLREASDRRARVAEQFKIRNQNRHLQQLIESSRADVVKKVTHTLTYVLQTLSALTPPHQGTQLAKFLAHSQCHCPVTGQTSTVTKDFVLLPLTKPAGNAPRQAEEEKSGTTTTPESSELSAYDDSSSADEGAWKERQRSVSAKTLLKPTSSDDDAAAHNPVHLRLARLVSDALDRQTDILMACNHCHKNGNIRYHKIHEKVVAVPAIFGLRVDDKRVLSEERCGAEMRRLVRKYLKLKSKGDACRRQLGRVENAITGRLRGLSLPPRLFVGEGKNGRWDVALDAAPGYEEYELFAIINGENSEWDRSTRSTLWRLYLHEYKLSASAGWMRRTEAEEIMVERPPSEDTVTSYIKLDGEWVLINGPLTSNVSDEDARCFGLPYRHPVCVFYGRPGLLKQGTWPTVVAAPPPPPSTSPPSKAEGRHADAGLPKNLSTNPARLQVPPFTPITSTEMRLVELGRFSVAVDAEYVVAAYVSKSKHHLLGSAPQCQLGRLSGIRTEPSFKDPTPLADYYTALTNVLDYRTEYSGLVPADLNPQTSRKWLTSRHALYRYVRYMVKNRCKFIGHDLFNDFRVIGIMVPSNLVIDTVLIYRLAPHSRLLSLRYLAWRVLSITVQNGSHDSIEDSWASLLLYRYYQQYVKERGEDEFLNDVVSQIYAAGYNTNFKTPLDT